MITEQVTNKEHNRLPNFVGNYTTRNKLARTILFLLFCFNAFCVEAGDKINVLLLSGANNHNWKETTPALKSILEESKIFKVTITEKPEEINATLLQNFDLILSNWNRFPEKNCNWTGKTRSAFMQFIKNGGGILFVHSATSTNYDWTEFQHLSGATWGKGTHHGKQAAFEVVIKNNKHPITKGLSNFWTTDELWVNMENHETANILAEAFSPKSNNGRDQMEPILFEQQLEKGRSVFLVLGHDKKAMQNIGFQTLLLRGAEWASTGKVKQVTPSMLFNNKKTKTSKFKWKEKENCLVLGNKKEIICKLNFDKSEGKPYFHPLKTVDGTNLTWMSPPDHPWHRAVWFSWKYINGVNYWEEDRETGISEGFTEIIDTRCIVIKNKGAQCDMIISYHPPQKTEILAEKRNIFISNPDENGNYYIDWNSEFTAKSDTVILDRTPLPNEPNGKRWGGYAGFSARLDKYLWNLTAINDQGETQDLHGKPSKWITFQVKDIKGKNVCMTIFDHPENLRHPNQWYIEETTKNPFYFFSPSPLFGSKLVLFKGQNLTLKYRLLISNGSVNQELIQSNWKQLKNR